MSVGSRGTCSANASASCLCPSWNQPQQLCSSCHRLWHHHPDNLSCTGHWVLTKKKKRFVLRKSVGWQLIRRGSKPAASSHNAGNRAPVVELLRARKGGDCCASSIITSWTAGVTTWGVGPDSWQKYGSVLATCLGKSTQWISVKCLLIANDTDFYFVKHNLIQNTVIPRVTDVPIHECKSDYEYDFWTNFASFHDWWLLSWKHPLLLPHNRWVKALLLTINLEKLGFSLKGSLNAFKNAWRLLLIHIESLSSLSVDVMVEPLGFRHIFISAGVIPLHKIFLHQIYFRGRKLNLFF